MTGTLAQLIALTSYGNAYLAGLTTDFYPENTTFQFCNVVDFREMKPAFLFSKATMSCLRKPGSRTSTARFWTSYKSLAKGNDNSPFNSAKLEGFVKKASAPISLVLTAPLVKFEQE